MLPSTHCIIRIRHPFPRGVWVAMMWQHQHWCWFRFQYPFQSFRPCTNTQTKFPDSLYHHTFTHSHNKPSLTSISRKLFNYPIRSTTSQSFLNPHSKALLSIDQYFHLTFSYISWKPHIVFLSQRVILVLSKHSYSRPPFNVPSHHPSIYQFTTTSVHLSSITSRSILTPPVLAETPPDYY